MAEHSGPAVVLVVVGIILALALGVATFGVLDAYAFVGATDFGNTEYRGTNGRLRDAYVTRRSADAIAPGVLLIPHDRGLDAEAVRLAELLSEQGYVVVAMDPYGGATAESFLGELVLRFSVEGEDVDAEVDAAYAFARSLEGVRSDRVAVVGFSSGGTYAIRLAQRNPHLPALAVFSARDPVTSAIHVASLGAGGPVLALYGRDDRIVSLANVRAFEAALTGSDVDARVFVYDGAGHGFVTSESVLAPGPAGDAWSIFIDFLGETLAQ